MTAVTVCVLHMDGEYGGTKIYASEELGRIALAEKALEAFKYFDKNALPKAIAPYVVRKKYAWLPKGEPLVWLPKGKPLTDPKAVVEIVKCYKSEQARGIFSNSDEKTDGWFLEELPVIGELSAVKA